MRIKTCSTLCLLILLFSCNTESTKKQQLTGNNQPIITDSPSVSVTEKYDTAFRLKLVAVEIIDTNSTDVYKKFGISTSGMCYECNLANIAIEKGKIRFSNICDSTNNLVFDIVKLTLNNQHMEVQFSAGSLIIEKLNQGPVYRIKITGGFKPDKSLKIMEYFSSEADIRKFEIHDCGDFQG